MNTRKVLRRIARMGESTEVADQVARDVGFGLARGQRDDLARVARELAAQAPEADGAGDEALASAYRAGMAAGLGTMLAAYEAAHERDDSRRAALRAASSDSARAAVAVLAEAPATGADLAARLNITPSAASKILASLRGAGVARVLGGQPYPKRGARKPHALTSLGTWLADELARGADASDSDALPYADVG